MKEAFKPLSLSIGEMFGNKDALYKIPQYQRPYKWDDDQVEKLWEDVWEAYENREENYFLGSIITAKPRDNENSAYVDIVDGQQRLTTLMIFFCVLRDLYPNINKNKAIDNPLAVDIDTISASITHLGKANRLKLYTHSQHQSDFANLIIDGDTSKLNKPSKKELRNDEEPKHKFINTAVIFRNKLESIGIQKTEDFINYLFNQVQIIRIDCKNREFAIKLFQVLNDRGIDLTASDLIKSFLLEKLYSLYKEDPDTSRLQEQQFIADWRETEVTIKTCDINLNDLFMLYAYFILGQNPKRSLNDELQDVFKNMNPNAVISDLKKFAETYLRLIFENDNIAIYSLWYLRWNFYWKSVLLTAYHTQYNDINFLAIELRRFYYLYWIAGKTLSQIKQTSFNLIKWIKEKKSITEIRAELNKKIDSDDVVTIAISNLMSSEIATEMWCKPLLMMMEYNATDDSKNVFIEINQDVHLEHIMPVKHFKFDEWRHMNEEDVNLWLNSAGNITLLGGSKNIEASNNPFSVKMEVYRGKGKYENKDEKITAFTITQQIVNDYHTRKFNGEWNLKALTARWNWFFAEVRQLLDVDVAEALNKGKPLV